jgi:hypothetical protein
MVASRGIDEGQSGKGQPMPSGSSLSHDLWLRRVLPGDLSFLPTVLIASVAIYVLAAVFAYMSGWLPTYLKSPAFGVGALGIAWVLGSIRNKKSKSNGRPHLHECA